MSAEEDPIKAEVPTEGEDPTANDPTCTFLTGVEIDADQWRAQAVEELTSWLDDIKNRKTEYGDQLVDFPEDWDKDINLSTNQQIDLISSGLAKSLTGAEAKEAQIDLQNIRAQADKLRALDKQLNSFKSDSDDEEKVESKEDEDLLDQEIVIPNIDVSGPNPFDIPEDQMKRLKEIDEQLGYKDDDNQKPTKTMAEINDELLKLYTTQTNKDGSEAADDNEHADTAPDTPLGTSAKKSPPPTKALKSAPPMSMRPIPPLMQLDGVSKPSGPKRNLTKK